MVRVGCVGDLHGALDRLDAALDWLAGRNVDALLLVGDFTGSGVRPEEAARSALRRSRRLERPVLYVPGNHDDPGLDLEGNVDRRLADVAGLRVFGLGGGGPARLGFPYEWTDGELADLQVPGCDVLLTHAPPARTRLDRLASGRHIGSDVVRRRAASAARALICGHVHESAGVDRIDGCVCLNAGSLGPPDGRVQAGLLEADPEAERARVRHFVRSAAGGWSCAGEASSVGAG